MQNGMAVSDFDSDGINEILVANSNQLYALEYNGVDYVQDWVYPFDLIPGGKITAIKIYDLDGDSRPEIIVGGSKKVLVLDGVSHRLVNEANIDFAVVRSIEIADMDNDGQLELCLLATGDFYSNIGVTYVYDLSTLNVEWQSVIAEYGTSMAVGYLDTDVYPEIVTAKGYVYGYNGSGYVNKWLYSGGFGSLVDTGDTNGDGIEEIIGTIDWTMMRAYDLATKSIAWTNDLGAIYNLKVANVDSDAEDEILVEDEFNYVTAYSYNTASNTLNKDWSINSVSHSASSITVGDADNDGEIEFIWGTGTTYSGDDLMVVAGLNPDISIEWQNSNPGELTGPFIGAEWMTVGTDENRAMFSFGEPFSYNGGSRLISMGILGDIQVSKKIDGRRAVGFSVIDYDLDGIDEVFSFNSIYGYENFTTYYDFVSDNVEWTSPTGLMAGIVSEHADLNMDGHDDFVVLTYTGYLYVYDAFNNNLIWQSDYLGDFGNDLVIHDMDGDNKSEIIVATRKKLIVMEKSASGFNVQNEINQPFVIDITVGDLNGDTIPEVICLVDNNQDSIIIYDNVLVKISDWSMSVIQQAKAVYIENSSYPRKNIILSVDGNYMSRFDSEEAYLAWFDPYQGIEIMRSPFLIGTPLINSLNFVDINDDGQLQLLFGTTQSMYMTQ